jgi:hypothetical protein
VVDREHKHCSSCEKVVVDFTAMSDDELVLFFQHNKQKTCGRFSQEQLQKTFTPLPETTRHSNWWKAAMLLPLTLFSKSSQAQQTDSVLIADPVTANPDSLNILTKENSDSSLVRLDSLVHNPDSIVVVDDDSTCSPEEPVVSTGTTITITLGPPTMGSIGTEPTIYGGFRQTIFMGDVAPAAPNPTLIAVGCIYNPVPEPIPPLGGFTESWSLRLWHKKHRVEFSATNPDVITENDPNQKKSDPIPPTIPDQPWYEAILPPSLRPRRNG